jgi:hypothetical protein
VIWIQHRWIGGHGQTANMTEADEVPNGTNDSDHTPTQPTTPPPRPKHTTLALTEYTANPSPASSPPKPRAHSIVPEHLLLPNGHPDVSQLAICFSFTSLHFTSLHRQVGPEQR